MTRVMLMLALATGAVAQSVEVRDAGTVVMPGQVDSNSPAFWLNGQFHLVNSVGAGPKLSWGANQFSLTSSQPMKIVEPRWWPAWIEAVWVDPTGVILGWYHQEHEYICNGRQRPAQPWIGSAISYDGGKTFYDQGIVLASGEPPNCSAKNGYFSGGHGDFSVVLDRDEKYFYFFFGNYAGPVETQGVSVARMAFEDRFSQTRAVWKYFDGSWSQPGVGGRSTPIFPARASWLDENTDSFWGPSIHWNTYLETYVILMNRSCCTTGFPQEGIYVTFNSDLSDPAGWSSPERILHGVNWYPQVIGVDENGTDSLAGRVARLYVSGESTWELVFRRAGEEAATPDQPQPESPTPEPPQPESPTPEPPAEPERDAN